MWLIERHSDGRSARRIALPDPVRAALVRWYTGQGSRADEAAGIMLVQQARIGEKWIACDCLPADAAPPILTPAFLSEAETYYLRRLTSAKRPEHQADCPFFRDQITNRITDVRSRETPADPPTGYFEALRPAPEKLAQAPREESSDDRTRNASVPRLARLLWRLMENSGLHRCAPLGQEGLDRSIGSEFRRLMAAAARIQIAPGIELGRALWTHATPFHSNKVYAALRALAREWPHGHAPQAFLTLFAPQIRGHSIAVAGCEPVIVANRVQSPSVRGNSVRGPFLVIVVAGEYPEALGYAALRAYAQPIYSGQRFVPVESEFERLVLRDILEAQHQFARAGIDIAIEKPLFDRLTPVGPCRPDFVIEARSRTTGEIRQIVIEAMGFSDDDYLASKAATHPLMALIAPVANVTPDDIRNRRVASIIAHTLGM